MEVARKGVSDDIVFSWEPLAVLPDVMFEESSCVRTGYLEFG